MDMRNRRLWIGLTVAVLAVALVVTAGFLWHHQEQQQLVELRNEALEKLERDKGQYDEQSIVLNGTSKAKAEELAELYGAELRITANGRFATLTLPEGTTIRDIYAMDESLKHIEDMAADYQVHVSEIETEEETDGERLPMRPQYSVSDTDYELQSYLDYLNMGNVWNNYKGNGITVAVIDTGIDTDHPEFAGRISEYSYNATEDKIVKDWDYDWSLIEDKVGHGTAVTGVIAATMGSGNVVGIAPNVNILVIKAECDEHGSFKRTSDLVFGLYYAIERDVQVVNMSFGTYDPLNPFEEAAQLAYDSDIICVAAAGNDSTSTLTYPAADPNVIGVGALGDGWMLAEYSNYGENTDLVAPGSTYTCEMGGGYATTQGTSLASPIVAGAIALYMQTDKYTTFDRVTEILYASCYDLGDLGRDWYYGFGALDISAFILEQRGKIIYDMLTDELENEDGIYIQGHTLQELPEPDRLYAVFDGWYYDDTFTQEYDYYTDRFYGEEITLYAKWANEDDGIPYTYVILDDGTVEIRSYTGHRRYITIPERIEGRIVSSIGDFAFSGQTRLREVGLPSGLRHIGLNAFSACSNLVTIQIPANVTQIEDYAFTDNIRLSSVVFLGNSKLQIIGKFAFQNCGKLERIELPASLKSINGSAFFGATSLNSITVQKGNTAFRSVDGVLFNLSGNTLVAFPAAHGNSYTLPTDTTTIGGYGFAYAKIKTVDLANVQTIGGYAFYGAALESLVIPDRVSNMGERAFAYNTKLAKVTIGRGLTQIPLETFVFTTSLNTVTIPNGITAIEGYAFSGSGLQSVIFEENSSLMLIGGSAFVGCNITEIDIPASVLEIRKAAFSGNPLVRVGFADNAVLHTIEKSAFAKCALLEEIHLPASLRTIGDNAFMSSALREVTIPANVISLGAGAFACCSNLTAITVEAGNGIYHDIDGVVHNLANTEIHAFPAGKAVDTYYIESTVRTIMPWSFAGTWCVNTIVLPEGLTVVEGYGFYQCGTRSYTLPSTLTNIMDFAFAGNWNITGIALPESLVQIAEGAFSSCTSLQYIHIPDNVLQIGRYAFAYDWNLRSITFNETAKLPRISFGAFSNCGLTSFRVPANVSAVAQKAFEGCNNLISFTFAQNSKLESISAYMFDGCINLQNITFEQGSALKGIQAHGLEGMDKLTSIDFGDTKLTNVDNFAFRFCESLSILNLPATVTNIGRYAFYGCKNLDELTIPKNVEHIGSYAFLGTGDIDLYFVNENLPAYLDENWDHGTKGYYTGVTSVKEEGNWKYAILESGSIAILKYLGEETNIDLSKLNLGASITTIGGSAFEGSTVQTIVLPNTLTAIQAEAFAYSDLTAITIPANVTFIGREAFAHTDITTLFFAAGSKLSVMEQYAFTGTKKLTSVILPKSLKTLGTGVFAESGLQSVVLESGIQITEIPQKAFTNTKLTSVALPDSVTLVNHNAFNNVQTLKSVTFGNNEGIRLMSNAFYHTGLETLHIPANVTYIGEYCFVALPNLKTFSVDENNPNYKAVDGLLLNKSGRKLVAVPSGRTGSLTVPAGVEEIGFGAFEESKLSEIKFLADANILTFGYRAFFKAENITSITIPKSVVSVDYYAFAYCENLQTVTFAEDNQLKGIYEGAFLGCINLENITIPDTIVEISDFAFYGCSKIDMLPISVNSNIKGIYDYAFAYTGLKGEFTTPETLWDIGNYAFLGCNFTKVTIPDTNKKILIIGIGAFEDCNQLTEITLPFIGAGYEDEVISWFGYIFGAGSYEANEVYVPDSLTTVTITDGITVIYTGGFAYCTGIETIHIPHSVSTLYSNAFKDVLAEHSFTNTIYVNGGGVSEGVFGRNIINNLVLHDDVNFIAYLAFANLNLDTISTAATTIAQHAFSHSGVREVILRDGVETIGIYAFTGCSKLVSITIPKTLKDVGRQAFGNLGVNGVFELKNVYIEDLAAWCEIEFEDGQAVPTYYAENIYIKGEILTDVVIPESVTEIKAYTFDGWEISSVRIHESMSYIAASAFSSCPQLKSIDLDINNPYYTVIDGVLYNEDLTDVLVVPRALEGIISIPDSAVLSNERIFSNCTYLAGIQVSENHPLYYTQDGVLYKKEDMSIIHVPKQIAGKVIIADGVKDFPYRAFAGREKITEVIIPDSITQLNQYAFYGCTSLERVKLSANLEIIGMGAFEGCNRLRDVEMSNRIAQIDAAAFANCISLAKILIPESVTSIADGAFSGCIHLYEVYNYSALTFQIGSQGNGQVAWYAKTIIDKDGNRTYKDENSSFEYVVSPENFKFILENGAYKLVEYTGSDDIVYLPDYIQGHTYELYNFFGAKKIVIPATMKNVGANAFYSSRSEVALESISVSNENPYYCAYDGILYDKPVTKIIHVPKNIAGDITILEGVTVLKRATFEYTSKLAGVTIPNSVTRVEDAFWACDSLQTVVFGAGITSIPSNVFWNCRNITKVTLGENVQQIGSGVFASCSKMEEIVIPDSVTEIGENAFHGDTKVLFGENAYFQVVDGILYDKPATRILQVTNRIPEHLIILEGVTSIPASAFYQNKTLESVVLPDSVITIGERAFWNCTNLSSVTFGSGIETIGWDAFQYCSLAKVDISDLASWCSVTFIGSLWQSGTLYHNGKPVTKLKIPEGVTCIKGGVFAHFTDIQSIYLPSTLSEVYAGAFNGTSIQELHISDISWWCETDFRSSVPANELYSNNELVTHLVIPNDVTIIGTSAFRGFDCIKSVSIPESVTIIGDSAFSNCSGLTNVVIPESVITIGDSAFYYCNSLMDVQLPKSVVAIGENAFYGVSGLTMEEGNQSYILLNQILYTIDFQRIIWVDKNISGKVIIADGVTEIGDEFDHCEQITEVILPDSVVKLVNHAFEQCGNLKHLVLGNGLTNWDDIDVYTWNVESITIGDSLNMDNAGYLSCAKVYVSPNNGLYVSVDGILFSKDMTQLVYIPDRATGTLTIPKTVTSLLNQYWGRLDAIAVEDGNEFVCAVDGILYNKALTEILCVPYGISGIVTIPDTVTKIGRSQFSGRMQLKGCVLGKGITEIPIFAFSGCGLQEIILPDGVSNIADYAFQNCTSLMKVVLPANLQTIGTTSFWGCNQLYEIHNKSLLQLTFGLSNYGYVASNAMKIVERDGTVRLRDGVSYEVIDTADGFRFYRQGTRYLLIGYYGDKETITLPQSINGNTYILSHFQGGTHIVIPDGMTEIPRSAFDDNSTLRKITIPASVKKIDYYAFAGCEKLEEVHISDIAAWVSIDFNQFYANPLNYAHNLYLNGELLTTLVIPEGVTSVKAYAFERCNSIQKVVFSDSVTEIGDSAFQMCDNLSEVLWSNNIERIGKCAFGYSYGVVIRDLPQHIAYLEEDAFAGCIVQILGIPESVRYIGRNALGTEWAQTAGVWIDKQYIIDGWLFGLADGVQYVDVRNIKGAVEGVFENYSESQYLKNVIWGTQLGNVTNVETIIITNITKFTPMIESGLTLKNVIIRDAVAMSDLRYCINLLKNVSGVTIYVEALEDDLRWDDNFPGWNNGNIVIYGDKWSYVDFHDSDGNLISSEPKRNSEIIRRPIVKLPAGTESDSYELMGWDLDGDGVVDSVPATTDVNITAKAIVRHIHTHIFGEWHQTKAPNCTERGEEQRYCQYCDHYETREIMENGHSYTSKVTAPTCTEKGYTTHTCACGYSYTDSEVAAIGHKDTNKDHICDNGCGVSQGTHADGSDADHKCDYGCGVDNMTAHSYTSKVTAPTCTEKGYTTHNCACGHSYTDSEVAAIGHKDTDKDHVCDNGCGVSQGTHADGNDADHKCDYGCGVVLSDHSYTSVVTKPTCTEKGYTTHTCACGNSYVDSYVDKIDHSFTNYVSDGNATTEADGTKTALCDYGCGTKDTVTDEGSKITVSNITSDKYTVSGGYISKINAGTTAAEFLKGINEAEYIIILKNGQQVTATTTLGTGMVVRLMVGDRVMKEVEVVISGDTSGDGKITVTDMISVKSHVLKKSTLEGANAKAADVSGDGVISITDFIQIKSHILGKSAIKPAAVETTTLSENTVKTSTLSEVVEVTEPAQDTAAEEIVIANEVLEETAEQVSVPASDYVSKEFLVPGKKSSLGIQAYHKERYV